MRRKKLGWNQSELAAQSGISVGTIKAIELDESSGWPATREAIAKALGCTVDDLYDAKDLAPPSPDVLIETIRNLSEENKKLRDSINLNPLEAIVVNAMRENELVELLILAVATQQEQFLEQFLHRATQHAKSAGDVAKSVADLTLVLKDGLPKPQS